MILIRNHLILSSTTVIFTKPQNECLMGIHNCDINADCTDTATAFRCSCKSGFTGNGFKSSDSMSPDVIASVSCVAIPTTTVATTTSTTTTTTTTSTTTTVLVRDRIQFAPVITAISPNFITANELYQNGQIEVNGTGFGNQSDGKYVVLENLNSELDTLTVHSWADDKILANFTDDQIVPGSYSIFLNSYNGHTSNAISLNVMDDEEIFNVHNAPGLKNDVFFEPEETELQPEEEEQSEESKSIASNLNKFCKAIDCIATIAHYVKARRKHNDELGQLFDMFETSFNKDVDFALTKRLKKLLKDQM